MQRSIRSTLTPMADEIVRTASPISGPEDLTRLLDLAAGKRCVMFGEASHGTHEYYRWRAALSRRLIEEHGFTFVAVEGDWPDLDRLNRYVHGDDEPSASAVLHLNRRWPTWMWANWEVAAFADWLRRHNAWNGATAVSMYGLDVYSLWESLAAVRDYLAEHRPSALEAAQRAFRCFEPYRESGHLYAQSAALTPTDCEGDVVELLSALRRMPQQGTESGPLERFSAEQNAFVAKNAELYYRTMIRGDSASWNVRDRHMMETLERIFEHQGPGAKGIVWEHNTHVGDARFTDMREAGMFNVGQLSRERFGDDVLLVGFGSHAGTVIAGRSWDAPMETMPVPPAEPGSWEAEFHGAGGVDRLLLSRDARGIEGFSQWRGHRAIGVVYDPEFERLGNYVPTLLPERYDAFIFLDETEALHPLHVSAEYAGPPDTYPWGF